MLGLLFGVFRLVASATWRVQWGFLFLNKYGSGRFPCRGESTFGIVLGSRKIQADVLRPKVAILSYIFLAFLFFMNAV